MQRKISRKRLLPAFRVDMSELGLLWTRLIGLFDKPEEVRSTMTVELPGETLDFDSFEELRDYPGLPATLSKFSLGIAAVGYGDGHNQRRIMLESNPLLESLPEIYASGESEAWCAGAIETVLSFVQPHKLWYSPVVSAPAGRILYALLMFVMGASIFFPKDYKIPLVFLYGLGAFALTLAMLYFGRRRLFPVCEISVRQKTGFVRNHIGELSLLVALISAVFTGIGLLTAK